MAKEVAAFIKLQIKGGAANPSPPVGPALGSKGVNIMDFCKQFNARTQDKAGKVLPVIITVYSDKSFDFVVKQPPVAIQLKEAAKVKSGSAQPNRDKVGEVTWEQIERGCRIAFAEGYTSVKLYFMMGLPTETLDDIKGIADTAQQVVDLFYKIPNRPKGKGVQVTISVACFVPKPDTPFQFCAQDRRESLREKQKYLLSCVHSRKIKVNYHDSTTSVLEGVFAKGDRRLGRVIETAFENGAFFDTWEEYFNYDRWLDAFKTCGLDPDFYNYRTIGLDEVTPWDHLDVGVTKAHLVREYNKALEAPPPPASAAPAVPTS